MRTTRFNVTYRDTNTNAAYNLENFEPKRKQEQKERPKPRLVKKPVTSKARKKAEERIAMRKTARILTVTIALLAAVGMLIFGRVELTEATSRLNKAKSELSLIESEVTRLEMELESKVSMNKIEEYATQKLGMVKQSRSQVVYISVVEGDRIISAKNINKPALE